MVSQLSKKKRVFCWEDSSQVLNFSLTLRESWQESQPPRRFVSGPETLVYLHALNALISFLFNSFIPTNLSPSKKMYNVHCTLYTQHGAKPFFLHVLPSTVYKVQWWQDVEIRTSDCWYSTLYHSSVCYWLTPVPVFQAWQNIFFFCCRWNFKSFWSDSFQEQIII